MGEKFGIGGIDIDPVHIDTTLVGQAKTEYEELKSIIESCKKAKSYTRSKIKRANEKVENIIGIAKSAIREYKAKQTKRRREELVEILTMVKRAKEAKSLIRSFEHDYILESDNSEDAEYRMHMTGWNREQADTEARKADPIDNIDIKLPGEDR